MLRTLIRRGLVVAGTRQRAVCARAHPLGPRSFSNKPINTTDDDILERFAVKTDHPDVDEDTGDRDDNDGLALDEAFTPEFEEIEAMYHRGATADDAEVDRPHMEAELRQLQKDLNDSDKIISEEWTLNTDNDVYFNPETGETKVPYEKSWKKYLARRAERSRAENVEATNKGYPDYLTPEKYHAAATSYPMDEMDIIRKKYNHLDFKALGKDLSEADNQFFQFPTIPNLLDWGPDPAGKKDMSNQEDWERENLKFLGMLPVKYHIATKSVFHSTKVGKKRSYGVLVVGGNGKGWAGFGYGKGLTPDAATRRAANKLRRNLMDIPLDENRTVCQSITGKHGRVKVVMKRTQRGHGVVAGPIMQAIFECFGVKDVSSKVVGSRGRNPLHVVYAAFQGLARTESPREIALSRGLNYYREFDPFVREKPPTERELKQQQQVIREHIKSAITQWNQRRDLSGRVEQLEEEEARRIAALGDSYQPHPDELLLKLIDESAPEDNRDRRPSHRGRRN